MERAGADRTGELIKDKYLIESFLGEGGMATVYRATHTMLGRTVALKVLHPELSRDKEVVRRFVREGQAASSVRHRNIVDVLDIDVDDGGLLFIVQEYLEGEALFERMERMGWKLPTRDVTALFSQIAAGVAVAHQKGVVHRDLKPENVFLVQEDDKLLAKVLDFGISKLPIEAGLVGPEKTGAGLADRRLTGAGQFMGTPTYMSPEQIYDARAVDARSDVWALGVMMYEALSGELPYPQEDLEELLAAIQTQDPRPLDEIAPEVPNAVVEIVSRCMRFAPEERFADAGALAEALERVQQKMSASGTRSYFALGEEVGAPESDDMPPDIALDLNEGVGQVGAPRGAPGPRPAFTSYAGESDPSIPIPGPNPGRRGSSMPSVARSVPGPPPSRVPFIAGGFVLLLMAGGAGWFLLARDRRPAAPAPTTSATVARPVADDGRARRSCEAARSRIISGAAMGSNSDGWVVELWLARDQPGLAKEDALEDLTGYGASELGGVAQGKIVLTPAKERNELVVRFEGDYVAPFFEAEGRSNYVALAERLVAVVKPDHAALYARCAHLGSHDVTAWFWGSSPGRAASSLLFAAGAHAEPPAVTIGAAGVGELDERTAGIDGKALERTAKEHGAEVRSGDTGTALRFPLGGPTRGAAASRGLAELTK